MSMMFVDVIICDYALPLPKEADDLKSPPIWNKVEFFTNSFTVTSWEKPTSFPVKYSIEDNGYIYREEEDGAIEKVDYTGKLIFNTLHIEEQNDYWIEFRVLFWKGDLKEIKLNEWKKQDNTERIEAQETMRKAFNTAIKRQGSGLYKVANFLKSILRFFLGMIKYTLGFILSLVWWLDSKLR